MKNIFLVVFSMTSGLMASAQTIPGVIETQLDALINREGYRTYDDTVTLNAVRDYIVHEFSTHADVTYRQDYLVNGVTYSNVIALVGLFQALEQLKDYSSEDYCIEFVAYTLEEPPFFRTTKMGSYIHAKSLHARGIEVHGMLSLEMIGYFSTEKKSQHYPIGILKLFYGDKGDYITVVRKMNKGKFARKFSRKYKHSKTIKTKKFTAPQSLQGIDFSDHLNYWALGYDAIMLTDTAFFRNANYHQGRIPLIPSILIAWLK